MMQFLKKASLNNIFYIFFFRKHKPIIKVPKRDTKGSRTAQDTRPSKNDSSNYDATVDAASGANIDVLNQSCAYSNRSNHNLSSKSERSTQAQVHFVDPNHPVNLGAIPKTILRKDCETNLKPVRPAPVVPDINIASAEMNTAIEAATALASTNPFHRTGSFRYQGFTPPQNPFSSFSSLPGIPTNLASSVSNDNFEMAPVRPLAQIPQPASSDVLVRTGSCRSRNHAVAGPPTMPKPMKSFDASKFKNLNTNGLPTLKTPLYRARSRDSVGPAMADLMELQLSLLDQQEEDAL